MAFAEQKERDVPMCSQSQHDLTPFRDVSAYPPPASSLNRDGCFVETPTRRQSRKGSLLETVTRIWKKMNEMTWQGFKPGDRGDWMQTSNGRAFYPMDPRPDEIHIDDIAAALSKLCRFSGHSRKFYSVAEHCVLLSRAASPSVAFEALMHDASEAYLSDIIRPIKPFLSNYREIEERLEAAIAKRFDLQYPMPAEVKRLDNAILADERDQAMATPPQDWRLPEPPLGVTLRFWSPDEAERRFLRAFDELSC